MKTTHIIVTLTVLLFSVSSNYAQTPKQPPKAQDAPVAGGPKDVTIEATIISMTNAEALQFSAERDLSGKAADALKAMKHLVAEKKALSVANLAVTTTAGGGGQARSGTITVKFTPMVSPDGKVADITSSVTIADHRFDTHFVASNGAVKFIGSVQSPTDKTMTEFVFARVSY
jgi:hypothetical protein